MKIRHIVSTVHAALLAVAMFSPICHAGATPVEKQSQASYEAAFATISTSPAYVLIAVADGSAQPEPVCTTANFLLGAIHFEYTPNQRSDDANETRIALGQRDHVFRFTQRASLNNVRKSYSEADLAAARTLLAPLSDAELTAKFSSLYGKDRLPMDGYARDAVACALIERGFSPRMADLSGQVYIER